MLPVKPLSGNCDTPYFIILLCLMPDGFSYCQPKSAATEWINMSQV